MGAGTNRSGDVIKVGTNRTSDVMRVGTNRSDVMKHGTNRSGDVMRVGTNRTADILRVGTNWSGIDSLLPVSAAQGSRYELLGKEAVVVGAKSGAMSTAVGARRVEEQEDHILMGSVVTYSQDISEKGNKRHRPAE